MIPIIKRKEEQLQHVMILKDQAVLDKKIRSGWEEVKEHITLIALRAKFDQYPELKQLLLSTAGHSFVEHTDNDNYWGDGGDGSGLNRLGILLIKLRDNSLNDKTGLTQ